MLRVANHRRMGRVEHVQALDAERPLQHLRGERRPPHAEQDERLEARSRVAGELVQLADPLLHPLGLVEPPQPLVLVGTSPDGRVPAPDTLDELLLGDDRHQACANSPRFALIPSISSSNESENFCTPSRSSVSTTPS